MLFLGLSADNEIITSDTDDIASALETAGYTRSAVLFTRYMAGDGAAALLGRQLGQTPGSSNWAMQTLTGVSADTLTSAAHEHARGKHAITYTTDRGVSHTWDGWAASGRYFDITHGVDALKADIETRCYQIILNAEKIPYNATGRAQVQSGIEAALVAAEGLPGVPGTIEPGWALALHRHHDRRGQLGDHRGNPDAMNEPILQFFAWEHLPAHLAAASQPFGVLAQTIVATLPLNAERTVALRKLLESKDAAVRAVIAKET
jgi:hypothetical protein